MTNFKGPMSYVLSPMPIMCRRHRTSDQGPRALLYFAWVICSFVIIALAVGCGSSTSTDSATTTSLSSVTTTTLASASSVSLSGSLNSGSISSAGVKASAAVAGYDVVAIDSATGLTYHATTDAAGAFAFSLPASASYEVSLINSDSTYFGPIVMVGDTSSSEVVMGITPTSDTSLGEIVVDSSGYAAPTTEPTSIADFGDLAEATSGVPKGAGSAGKEEIAGITTRESGADLDKDGIPNIFDADEDNDGIRNGITSTPIGATVSSNTVESVQISSNIWATHGSTEEAPEQIAMRLHVYPVAGHEDEITSVECISVPATIRDIATIRGASSLGDPTDYPTEGSVWADSGHQLYQSTTLSNNHWIVSVKPKAIMKVGDTFTIRVHYTGGGYQDFYLTTAYVLTDWARISTYYSATMTSTVGTRVASEVATFNTSSLEVVFTKPLDEDGNVLDGLHYSIIAGFVTDEASGDETLPVPGVSNDIEYQATAYPASFTEGIDTITVSLHELVTFEAGSYYYITPVAESADGQRNGEEYWFKKL